MVANYSKHYTAESFFIHQKAPEVNLFNETGGANMPIVYSMLMD